MRLRGWYALGLLLACAPSVRFPSAIDAGPLRVVECVVVDWLGVERRAPVLAVGGFGLDQAEACWCGASPGYARCSYNPSTQRFDGACTECDRQQCSRASQTCVCPDGSNSLFDCVPDGGVVCRCPINCEGDSRAVAQGLFCRCANGAPGEIRCSLADRAPVCDCSAFDAFDGGR